jgi:hypothetical protein
VTDQWGRGLACLSQCARACAQLWVALAFSVGFQRKEFLYFYEIAFEIYNLLILAPKIVKQNLVYFLGLDL